MLVLIGKSSEAPLSLTVLSLMYAPIPETVERQQRNGCMMRKCIRRDGKLNAQMHGWMVLNPSSRGSIPPLPAGKDGTSLRLSLFSLKNFTIQNSLNNFII